MLVLALRMAEHRGAPHYDIEAVERGDFIEVQSLTTNVKSIAAATGIPEETVRRKVRALVADGWIARHGHELSYTLQAAQALTPLRRLLIRGALRNHRTVQGLLKVAGQSA
jgi:hypothetical protein